jgi:RimJ/RimL family protein N-acetyltransferase
MAYAGTAPVLETERLWLRPLKEEDAGHFEALFRADWEAVKQTGRMPYPPTAATLQVWIRGNLAGPGHAFLIRRKSDQAVIGTVGFGGEGAIAEVGYALGRAYWGQGYATPPAIAFRANATAPAIRSPSMIS